LILAVTEGITEFLPVSSTGHLLLLQHLFGAKANLVQRSDLFNTVIQTGAVLAVLAVFGRRVVHLARSWQSREEGQYIAKLLTSFAVTVIGGLGLKLAGLHLPTSPGPVIWATIVGGLGIIAVEAYLKGKEGSSGITWPTAVMVGIAQLVAAIFPGTSRSAATILAAMAMGVARRQAVEFSFLLGVPTLLAAGLLEVGLGVLRPGRAVQEDWAQLSFAMMVAAGTAFLTVRWLLGYVQRHTFRPFAWYRLVLGGLIMWIY
jgi:undecaprenyl-diphosphatase